MTRQPRPARWLSEIHAERTGLPLDLDGWPYREIDPPLGDDRFWRVTPCCGAFAEYNNTGVGDPGLICKACANYLPEGFVDGPAHLDPTQPPPQEVVFVVDLSAQTSAPAEPEEAPMNDASTAYADQTPDQPVAEGMCQGGCGLPAAVADRTGRGVRKGDVLKYASGHRNSLICQAAGDQRRSEEAVAARAAEQAQASIRDQVVHDREVEGLTLAELKAKYGQAFKLSMLEGVDAVERPPVLGSHSEHQPTRRRTRRASSSSRSSVTDDQVREIRRLRAEDPKTWTYRALGAHVGIDDQTAWNIVKGKTHADVPEEVSA
jgi:hypothetical protein